MNVHYQADPSIIRARKVAVIGYGSQGHAHALNLKESGVEVTVGLREGSSSAAEARTKGVEVRSIAEAAAWGDVIMMLIPDQHHREVYEQYVVDQLEPGDALGFSHGFTVHYEQIQPPEGVDVFMVAPKSPGHLVRRTYEEGNGVPCLAAVAQDASGYALQLALSYADAIGGTHAGVIETTFKDETETDLFGEQAVLCGGSEELIKAGFETLVEAGYPPELAYFECLHELKLIVDLYYEGGLAHMYHSVSDTAEYGGGTRGSRVIDEGVRKRMKEILAEVQSGAFAEEWLKENEAGIPNLKKQREEIGSHPLERIGKKLRSMMPWLKTEEEETEKLAKA